MKEGSQPVVTMAPDDGRPDSTDTPNPQAVKEPIYWQADEYVQHEKSVGWYIGFALICLGLMALSIWVIDSLTFAILIPVMAVALLIYSHRRPHQIDYTLSHQGLHFNDHLYPFNEFKSFGVVREGEHFSAVLIPVKRFNPAVTIYFPESVGEQLVDLLAAHLPMHEAKPDFVDRLLRRLRI